MAADPATDITPASGPDPARNTTGAGDNMAEKTPTSENYHHQPRKGSWWKIHLFRGMVNDVHRRLPYFWSDWTDAWNYRVVPATVYMYFAKWVPTLFFCLQSSFFFPPFIHCNQELEQI